MIDIRLRGRVYTKYLQVIHDMFDNELEKNELILVTWISFYLYITRSKKMATYQRTVFTSWLDLDLVFKQQCSHDLISDRFKEERTG